MTPSDKHDLQRTITQQRERIDLLTNAIKQLQSDTNKIADLIKLHDQQNEDFKKATPEDGL